MDRKTFDLGNMSDARAERVKAALHGRTYMDFEVSLGRIPGPEMNVLLSTTYDADATEILTFALWTLAHADLAAK